MRSPARAHLLPGVTSARTWIKQRDFQNCYLLEKLADPLAAMAQARGNREEFEAYLDLAWRMEIQNHPHDSICGCSIDQVHQDMRYRFDQAAVTGEMVVRKASRAILGRGGGRPAIAVFNPGFARRALVTGEIEIEDPAGTYAAMDSRGRRIPAAIEIARGGRSSDIEMPAADFKRVVAGLSSAELMGRFVNRFELRETDPQRLEIDLFMSRSALSDLDLAEFKRRIAAVPDEAALRIHAVAPARANIGFVADGLAQTGFSFYRLLRDDSSGSQSALDAATGSMSIENGRYRLAQSARGLTIEDLEIGRARSIELYFEDDGDRGDEYNFDPVPGASTLSRPESIAARVIERGPVRSRIAISLAYELPVALASGRRARANQTVRLAIELTATLYAGLDRIDFELTIDNRARDHRIRAAVATPVHATEALSDTSFGIVRRALEPAEPPGTEDIYPTAPHRTMTAAESPDFSVALLSRGLYEAEVRPGPEGATILLTVLRCVGWLSRSDLQTRRGGAGPEMETPGAQELGPHRFEFALTTWKGGYSDSETVQRCHAYAFPPRLFNFSAPLADDLEIASLCECDNPRIVFSTARASRRVGTHIVRVYNSSEHGETARFKFATKGAVRIVDLRGIPVRDAGARRRGGAIELNLRPFQIVTFRVSGSTGK